ncbi:Additional substrate-specific component CbiN of cobalt ECF transporter [Pseudonocardia sp. Ae406_Ps2]|uniref:Cobalt transport protein CbiN n=1 Tax=Pseudonocardia tropica TaxID=681289 RepID=A0ABV1JX86_9PSEU|nr:MULTISPECIES: energy-coupling factor ABC transporter substrate-binding protein [unclassified Pseudonocardia]ALE82625.1 cobalamin biosynthesis protein CbiN [Pseudonocardia sp. HH130629-09]OLL99652.1 Additional substrate-specific component CbiN of cobalt ECF transporter [Pseudonocardia sp. Ae331_Ps2]OLM02600.1 Additional substrate-specific component CbiN of cobalt ECF transporter [Pseudonocardia sp. Ae406_Ps2]OLM12567.1 Additional substrate-specific component CbiN of cobalt ECF transporter [Ps
MSRSTVVNILLVVAVVALFAVPVLFVPGEYAGSDGQAGEAIEATGYQPWFSPVWEPPSGEIESGIFAMQAAAGAGVLGYCIGVARTRSREKAARQT